MPVGLITFLLKPRIFFLLVALYACLRLVLMPGVTFIPRYPLPTGISWLWTYRKDYLNQVRIVSGDLKETSLICLNRRSACCAA